MDGWRGMVRSFRITRQWHGGKKTNFSRIRRLARGRGRPHRLRDEHRKRLLKLKTQLRVQVQVRNVLQSSHVPLCLRCESISRPLSLRLHHSRGGEVARTLLPTWNPTLPSTSPRKRARCHPVHIGIRLAGAAPSDTSATTYTRKNGAREKPLTCRTS